MPAWQVALVVLVAVFVGMWIPVSLQLFATLRASKQSIEALGSRSEQTLSEISTTVGALNRTIADVGEVAHAAAQIKDSIRIIASIGAALGPAAIALVRALREPEPEADAQHPAGDNGPSVTARRSAPAQKESAS